MDLRVVVALVLTALSFLCTGRAQLIEESKKVLSATSHGASKSSGNSVSQSSLGNNYGQGSSAYDPNNNADQLKYNYYYAQQTPQQQQYYSYYYPQAAGAKPMSNGVMSVNRESGVAVDDQGRGQGWGQMDTQGYGQTQMQGWGMGGQGTSQTKGSDGGLLNGLGNVFGNGGGGGGDMSGGGLFGTLTDMISNMLSLLGMDDNNTNGINNNNQMGYGGGDGWGQPNMMMSTGAGGGAGGGIGSLVGILVGKKAGILKTKALLLLFSPIIIPLVLLVLAAIVGIILAIPIPVYEPVGNSRSNQQRVGYFGLGKSLEFAKAALESEECVERVTCEMMKTTRDFVSQDWTKRKLESIGGGGWTGKLEKSFAVAKAGKSCLEFKCSKVEGPFKTIQTFFLSRGPARQRVRKPKKGTKTKLI